MAITIRGTDALIKKGDMSPLFRIPGLAYKGLVQRKSPTAGFQWILTYESPASNDQSKLSPAQVGYGLISSTFSAEIQASGPVHRLTISTPDDPTGAGNSAIIPNYELLDNVSQKDLREHEKALNLGAAVVHTIDSVISGALDPNTGTVAKESEIPSGEARVLYDKLRQRNGSASFFQSNFVFKYSFTTGRRSAIAIAYANKNKIYRTDQMLAETGPPGGILTSIEEAVTQNPPSIILDGHTHGWLKMSPNVTNTARNMVQLSGEFILDVWDTWIYATA